MLSGDVQKANQALDDWLASVLICFDLVLHHDVPTLGVVSSQPGVMGLGEAAWVTGRQENSRCTERGLGFSSAPVNCCMREAQSRSRPFALPRDARYADFNVKSTSSF